MRGDDPHARLAAGRRRKPDAIPGRFGRPGECRRLLEIAGIPARTREVRSMSERHKRFVAAYLGPCRFNATAAARMVGYAWPGKTGPRLTQRPYVHAAISEGFRKILERVGPPEHVGD